MHNFNKISVFGGTGFIGGRFCEMFPEECVRIPYDNREPETNNVLYFISTVHNYNVFDNPHLDINTNLNVLMNVLESCRKQNREGLVFNFISSWFVYGKTKDLPAREDSYCEPKGVYSITKRTAEQLLVSYCETYDINYRIMRLASIYGEGDMKVSKKKNALQYMIEQIASHHDIDLYDGGVHLRDFMYVDDACSALKLCIEKAPLNEIINIGSGIPISIGELMVYVKEKLNSTSKFNHVEPPHFHNIVQITNMYLNINKLKSLNFISQYDIKKGLDKILEKYKK